MTVPAEKPGLADRLRQLRVPTFARALLPTMAGMGIQLLAFVITARGLGVTQFGIYTSILAVSVIATDFVGLGAHEVLMRETARQRSAFRNCFGHVLSMSALSLLPIGLIAWGIAAGVMKVPLDHALLACALLAEIVIARALNNVESFMVAHGDAVRSSGMRLRGALFRLGAAALYFGVLGQSSLQGWVFSIVALMVVVLAYCWWRSVSLYGRPQHGLMRDGITDGVLLALPQLAFSILSNVDRIALARFVAPAEVGAYGAAARALQLGLFPLQIGTRITYPHFFAAQNTGARQGLRFATKVSLAMLLLGVVSMGLVIAVSYAVPYIFGKDFSAAQPLLMVLSLSLPMIGLVTPPADVLTSLNRPGLRASCYLAVAVAFIAVAALAAQHHGALGVAWAYVGAIAALALSMWACLLVLARRERGA